jgi:hypothetical protein
MASKIDISKHTTKFGGNPYVMVSGRVLLAHEDNPDALSIETEIAFMDADSITVKAKVTTRKGVFTGHATSYLKTGSPQEKKTPLEVAETSAIGRALGVAGYAVEGGIASADEMQRHTERTQNGHQVAEEPPSVLPPPSVLLDRYNAAVMSAQKVGREKVEELRSAWLQIVGRRKGGFEDFPPALQSRIVETFEGLLVGALPEEEEEEAAK